MTTLTWQKSLEKLKVGNNNFVTDSLDTKDHDRSRRQELAEKQNPFAVILTCSDSRVVPEFIFNTGFGDLFVIRIAGNVASPSALGSIEFAVKDLGVKLVVVMGHESCGAIQAAMEEGESHKNLDFLIRFIQPAIPSSDEKKLETVVRCHAKNTAKVLAEKSDILAKVLDKGDLRIIPAYYQFISGQVEFEETV